LARHRRQAQTGKEAVSAATQVFAAHGTFIRAVIRFQAKNRSQEEDFYQDFFLSLIRKPIPADIQNVRSYLYRAIRNDVLDFMRRQSKQQEHLEKHAEEIRISINNRTPTDAIVLGDERTVAFRYLTRQLRLREAEAVTLRFRDNCSIADIAARMGVERRTVSRYLSAGLRRLRQVLVIE
jgi:RNA polymerase sigma-70 factor (ECF subfamily)